MWPLGRKKKEAEREEIIKKYRGRSINKSAEELFGAIATLKTAVTRNHSKLKATLKTQLSSEIVSLVDDLQNIEKAYRLDENKKVPAKKSTTRRRPKPKMPAAINNGIEGMHKALAKFKVDLMDMKRSGLLSTRPAKRRAQAVVLAAVGELASLHRHATKKPLPVNEDLQAYMDTIKEDLMKDDKPSLTEATALISEMGPEDFGADRARENREEEIIGTVGGSGTMPRSSARRHLKRKFSMVVEKIEDPDWDGSVTGEFVNILEWFNAIYGDDPKFKNVESAMKRIMKSHGHK